MQLPGSRSAALRSQRPRPRWRREPPWNAERKGRKKGEKGRRRGGAPHRSPLTCSAVPRALPAAQPARTPGMQPGSAGAAPLPPAAEGSGSSRGPGEAAEEAGRRGGTGSHPRPPDSPARSARGCSVTGGGERAVRPGSAAGAQLRRPGKNSSPVAERAARRAAGEPGVLPAKPPRARPAGFCPLWGCSGTYRGSARSGTRCSVAMHFL